ncbi:MAG: iron ABC transporter permease [Kyrpidia sp.]|nr:iron ABC transporter permease [Kyrpidia sp.]
MKTGRIWAWGVVLAGAAAVSLAASVALGPVPLGPAMVWRALAAGWSGGSAGPDWVRSVVWEIRLPRAVLALLVGASLGAAGTAYQGVLRNPLADPFVLGVSSGAALAAAGGILFGGQIGFYGLFAVPVLAFFGGLLGLGAVFWLGALGDGRMRNDTLILAGVVVQSFFGAVLTLLIYTSSDRMPSVMLWLLGSLANRDPRLVWSLSPYVLVGLTALWAQARNLNVLSLGEAEAAHLGVEVVRTRLMILAAASLMTAAAVSVSGIIGFVGLVVPHVLRLLTGPDHRTLVPLSALGGGVFLLWADNAARTLIPGQEIPIGAITAFFGAPFFAYLLRRRVAK